MSTPKKKITVTRAFLISLAVLILCSILNWGVVSSWGNVSVTSLTLPGSDGQKYTSILYIPDSATSTTPAPVFVSYHGASGISRNQEAWCIEMARRGFVSISADIGGGGESNLYKGTGNDHAKVALEYVLSLDCVDASRLVLSGHSNGSRPAGLLASEFNAAGVVFASLSGQTQEGWQGDVLCVQGDSDRLDNLEVVSEKALHDFQTIGHTELTSVEPGVVYGSFDTNDWGKLYMVKNCVHEGPLYKTDAIEQIIDFTQECVGYSTVPNPIAGSNQTWYWRDVISFFGMLAFLVTMLLLADLLMTAVPFFAALRQPIPRNIGLRGKGLAISIVAAVAFPLISLYTGAFGLNTILGTNTSPLFSMGQSNRVFAAVIGINLLGILMLILFTLTEGKKQKAALCDFGITYEGQKKISLPMIGRAFLLSLTVLFVMLTYLRWQEKYLGTEFYCWMFGFRALSLAKLSKYIAYIVVWVICFIVAAIGLNVERRLPSTGSETKDTVIAYVFNTLMSCVTITVVVFLHFQIQYRIGGGVNAMNSFGIPITRLFGMPFGMAIAGIGQTFCFRKSGSIWLGAFLMGIFCALTCVTFGQYNIPLPA